MKFTRWIGLGATLGALLALGGCVGVPTGSGYGYGNDYGYDGQDGYGYDQPYYGQPAPSVYLGVESRPRYVERYPQPIYVPQPGYPRGYGRGYDGGRGNRRGPPIAVPYPVPVPTPGVSIGGARQPGARPDGRRGEGRGERRDRRGANTFDGFPAMPSARTGPQMPTVRNPFGANGAGNTQ